MTDAKRKITVGTVSVGERGKELVLEALNRGRISSGRLVEQFEKAFAGYHGRRHGVAVSSGTDADAAAVATLYERGAARGDEVIVPALTFISVANAVMHAGFLPVFADIDRRSWNLDPDAVEKAVSKRTRAIIAVHNFGRPAAMDELAAIASSRGLALIEDAAEAHGARYKDRLVGTIGSMAAYSFYVAHILTTGEGGMVITDDDELAALLRSLRAHGRACDCRVCVLNTDSAYCPLRYEYGDDIDIRFHFKRVGFSSKMNEMEAALGIEQVERIDEIVEKRRRNLRYLNEAFSRYKGFLELFEEEPHEEISPLCYPVVLTADAPFERFEMTRFLEQRGIETRPMFGSIPTQQPSYRWTGHRTGDFPAAEYVGARGFYIGCHQNVSKEDLDYVVENFAEFLGKY